MNNQTYLSLVLTLMDRIDVSIHLKYYYIDSIGKYRIMYYDKNGWKLKYIIDFNNMIIHDYKSIIYFISCDYMLENILEVINISTSSKLYKTGNGSFYYDTILKSM